MTKQQLKARAIRWQHEARTSAGCQRSRFQAGASGQIYWQEESAHDAENARNALFALIDHKGE